MKHRASKALSAFMLAVIMLLQMVPAQTFAADTSYADSGAPGSSVVQEETGPTENEQPGTPTDEEHPDESPAITGLNEAPPVTADEDLGYMLGLKWRTDNPDNYYDWSYETLDSSTISLMYELTVHMNGSEFEANEMEIWIPAGLWTDRNGKEVLPSDYGVPKAPATSEENSVVFHYRIEKKDGVSYVVFKNYGALKASENYVIQVAYSITPSQTISDSTAKLEAVGVIKDEPEDAKSNEITYNLTTDVELTNVTKVINRNNCGPMYTWDSKTWGDRPADFAQYNWVVYYVTVQGKASQPWTMEFTDTPDHDGTVYEYARNSSSGSITYNPDTNTAITSLSLGNPGAYSTNLYYVLVKYPKAQVPDGTALENKLNVKILGIDGAEDELDTTCKHTWVDYKFEYDGDLVVISKGATQAGSPTWTEHGTLTRLRYGLDAALGSWSVWTTVYGYNLSPVYTVEVTDDYRNWPVGGSNSQMSGEDYFVDSISFMIKTYRKSSSGEETYPGIGGYNPTYTVYALVEGGADYQAVATGSLTDLSNSNSGLIPMPANTIHARLTISGCEDYINVLMRVYDVVKSSNTTRQWLAENPDTGRLDITNYAMVRVYDSDGKWLNKGEESAYNTSSGALKEWDQETYGDYVQRASAAKYLSGGINSGSFRKHFMGAENMPEKEQVLVRYSLDGYETYGDVTADLYEEMVEQGWTPADRRSLLFYDLLPLGTFYDQSYAPTVTRPDSSTPMAHTLEIETIDDYKGTSRQMVIFHITLDETEIAWWAPNDTADLKAGAKIVFQAVVPWNNLLYASNAYNLAAYQTCAAGESLLGNGVTDSGLPGELSDQKYFKDVLDADGNLAMADLRGDGVDSVKDTLLRYSKQTIDVSTSMMEGLTKRVRSLASAAGSYGRTAVVNAGEGYEYRLEFYNSQDGSVTDLILFDRLEQAANRDENSGETGRRGVFESLDLNYIESVGIKPTVYYSTADTPAYFTATDIKNNTVPADWSTTEPDDKSTITAVAVDLSKSKDGTDFTFRQGMGTRLLIRMTAPQTVPEEAFAYNYAAYSSTYTATGGNANSEMDETTPTTVQILVAEKPDADSGSLAVSKTVSGKGAEKDKLFKFTVKFSDKNSDPLTGSFDYTGSYFGSIANGGTISLKHGEKVTISGLPEGTKYVVTEDSDSAEGYSVTAINAGGTIQSNQTAEAAFTNTKDRTPVGPGGNPDPNPDPDPNPNPNPDPNPDPKPGENIPDNKIPGAGIEIPKTGDTAAESWLWLMLLSLSGLCAILYTEQKRRKGLKN